MTIQNGDNIVILDAATTNTEELQQKVDGIYEKQGGRDTSQKYQFGQDRTLILLKPGTYDIEIKVSYYTSVAGLGKSPADVIVRNVTSWDAMDGHSTENFWRSVENLTIRPKTDAANIFSVSQAAPIRRIIVDGNLNLSQHGWSSGGFMADSIVSKQVTPISQQQWITRNTKMGNWAGVNWNYVFVGCEGGPTVSSCGNNKSTVVKDTTPVIAQKPTLFLENDKYKILRPEQKQNAGAVSIEEFKKGEVIDVDTTCYVTDPKTDTDTEINRELSNGKHILLMPGVYELKDSIKVNKQNAMVIGFGMATLISPQNGNPCIVVGDDVNNVVVSSMIFSAIGNTTKKITSLLQWGTKTPTADTTDKNIANGFAYDIFCRVGGNADGDTECEAMVEINSNAIVGDNMWLWRADHGDNVGWTKNIANNALVVNGHDVKMYGLAGEHTQKDIILWRGDRGKTYFYQSEMAYDGATGGSDYGNNVVSYRVTGKGHEAYGVGAYAFFGAGPTSTVPAHPKQIVKNAFVTPDDAKMIQPFTVSLFQGGFINIWNGKGAGASGEGKQWQYLCNANTDPGDPKKNDPNSADLQKNDHAARTVAIVIGGTILLSMIIVIVVLSMKRRNLKIN
jgi:hypothetical protein